MKTKEDKHDWTKVGKIDLMEIWKTPTKYVLSFSYERRCHFFNTYEECVAKAKEILKEMS